MYVPRRNFFIPKQVTPSNFYFFNSLLTNTAEKDIQALAEFELGSLELKERLLTTGPLPMVLIGTRTLPKSSFFENESIKSFEWIDNPSVYEVPSLSSA